MRHALPFVSALLLWLAFPPADLGFFGWIALVPLIVYATTETKRWRAFVLPWAAGFLFFMSSIGWLRFTTGWWGPPAVGLYLGLYWGTFALLARWACRGAGWPVVAVAPAAWLALEFLRSYLFTGLPLFLVGYTTHRFESIMQIADLGGVWLVSAVVLLANAALARAFIPPKNDRQYNIGAAIAAGAIILSVIYGAIRLGTIRLEDGMRIAVIQANIPQDVKELAKVRSPQERQRIWQLHMDLTTEAAQRTPDLIIWPEVATLDELVFMPGEGWEEDKYFRRTQAPSVETGIPALIGSMVIEPPADDRFDYERAAFTNSAIYFDGAGKIVGRFDKMRLVPFAERMLFGEFLPVGKWVAGFLKLSKIFEFRPGTRFPVFDHPKGPFAALICSENYYPEISREFARKGARTLVNISNDGWFRESAELDQMLAMAKFRAIENRVHYVRATNTGISAMIEPTGAIAHVIQDSEGRRKSVRGTLVETARVTRGESLYRVAGDWAAWLCAGLTVGGVALLLGTRRGRASVDSQK